jgi:hypothetical protein
MNRIRIGILGDDDMAAINLVSFRGSTPISGVGFRVLRKRSLSNKSRFHRGLDYG